MKGQIAHNCLIPQSPHIHKTVFEQNIKRLKHDEGIKNIYRCAQHKQKNKSTLLSLKCSQRDSAH